jgi:Flp pilus assembly protein CpaB
MKPRSILLLTVALSCGVAAAVVVKKFSENLTQPSTELVLVAVANLKQGDRIVDLERQLEKREYIKGTVPDGAFRPEDAQARPGDMLNKVLMKSLAKGEPLTERHLKDDSIGDLIPHGYRAISVPVRLDQSVTGFATPGTRVDLVASFSQDSKLIAQIFLQNAKVLAVGTDLEKLPEQKAMAHAQVATLAVLPRDAERIIWALRQGGNISMVLRKLGDEEIVRTNGTESLHGRETEDDPLTEEILVARQDVDGNADLKDVNGLFEQKRVPAGLFSSESVVKGVNDPALVGARLKTPLKRGTPLLRTLLDATVPVVPRPSHVMTIYTSSRTSRVTFVKGADDVWSGESRDAAQ